MALQAPDIYGLDISQGNVKEVQNTAKEKLQNTANYADIMKDLEINVVLKQTEIEKNTLRIFSYATDPNRGGNVDMQDGKGSRWVTGKKIYDLLAKKIESASGYMPPADKKAKVFYDISFRLKQLGYDKNAKGELLIFSTEYNNDFAIAIMAFQKMSGASKIESIVGPETLWKLVQDMPKVEDASEDKVSQETKKETIPGENNATEEGTIEDISKEEILQEGNEGKKEDIDLEKIKSFSQIYSLSNDMDNISYEQLNNLDYLNNKMNKNEELYNKLEQSVVAKIEKEYTANKVKTFEGNIANNVREIMINFSDGYLQDNTPEQRELEVDPKFYIAIRDSILEWLSSTEKTNEEKRWLIYFVRSFTSNFNDILQLYEAKLMPFEKQKKSKKQKKE